LKKSIILFSFEFPPVTTGGIGKVAFQKYRKFQEYGYTVHLVSTVKSKNRKSLWYAIPPKNNFIKVTKSFLYCLWIIIRFSPRFIYCLSGTYIGFIAFLLHKLFATPYFIMAHGHEFMQFGAQSFISKILKIVYNNAAAVFSVSNFTKRELLKRGVKKHKVHTVYNSIESPDPNIVKSHDILREKDRLHVSPSGLVLLTVSRLDKRKGHSNVIRALKDIFSEIPEAREKILYIITGSGPEEQRITKLISEYKLEKNVILYGHVSEDKLPLLYTLADLFIMPNVIIHDRGNVEGFGIVFLEAAVHGLPSIAGIHGGSAEVVLDGETGFLVNGNNVAEIKEKILLFYSHRNLCKDLGKKAQQFCTTRFSLDTIFAHEYKLITHYLKNRGSSCK
jgi:glycosyltransferase involved in cell wall biosynthesis